MGGLWVDYNLQSTVPGLFVLGEANFSDHGANRLGASALMQGLADGYFVAPYTVGNYIGSNKFEPVTTDHPAFKASEKEVDDLVKKLLAVNGTKTAHELNRELGLIMWEYVGMGRSEEGLKKALEEIPKLREEFWKSIKVAGTGETLNQNLEEAGRLADYLELAELIARDALNRRESCGGHFREESQTPEGEAKRDDENYSYVAAWQFKGTEEAPELHKESLTFEHVPLTQRSYK